jgi:glutaredoxin
VHDRNARSCGHCISVPSTDQQITQQLHGAPEPPEEAGADEDDDEEDEEAAEADAACS